MRRLRFEALSLAFVLLMPSLIVAQTVNARLEGVVHDQTGAVVPGVSVVATNTGTNID